MTPVKNRANRTLFLQKIQKGRKGASLMSTITTKDGTEIYYKDWGAGPVITFSHGWPLNSDA